MEKHRHAAYEATTSVDSDEVIEAARETWDEAVRLGRSHGYRNAQATVLAPTGTIGLMMDCDTAGIEPGGLRPGQVQEAGGRLMLKIVNTTVPAALRKLGFDENKVKEIVEYIDENDTVEDLRTCSTSTSRFSTAPSSRSRARARSRPWAGHVRMMAAVRPSSPAPCQRP